MLFYYAAHLLSYILHVTVYIREAVSSVATTLFTFSAFSQHDIWSFHSYFCLYFAKNYV